MSSTEQQKEDARSDHSLVSFNSLRILLAIYFFIYAYIVGKSLIPLPDEPPRINFSGVFCLAGGLIISFSFLVSRYRLFIAGVFFFIPLAAWQLGDKMKFLEMMLESTDVVKVTRYSLGLVMLVLMSPPVLRLFNKPINGYQAKAPILLKKGFPF